MFSQANGLSEGSGEDRSLEIVRRTPWWMISSGIHTVAFLAIGFFWAVKAAPEEDAVVVSPPRKPRPLPELEKPRNLDPNKKILDIQKSADEPVYKKNAEEADHNETDDNEEFKQAKGDSLDFVSDRPFKGKGTYDVVGAGGGGGGRFGHRLGGKRNLVARGGGGGDTEDAVLAALKWLSRHQSADGSWKVQGYVSECKKIPKYAQGGNCTPNPGHEDFDAGVTGLSLLAFLGAGYSHLSKDTYDGICFGDVVRKGLQWMMSHQDPEGCIGSRNAQKYMYNHTICALAMSEAYGLTGSNLFKDQAQKAVDFVIAAQNPGKGWRYSYKCGDNDSSVTGWAVMVLKSAEISGLTFPRSGYDGTRAWLDEVTEEGYGRVGYTHKGTGKVFVPGLNENFDHHEALTAIGVMARIFMDKNKADPRLASGCD
ncbi:MAG: prenyltransferase/squalene oxidase repeat-containing protein, partial [Planctomycetota bacterium]